MDYFEHNDLICFSEKIKTYTSGYGKYKRTHFEIKNLKYSIVFNSGILGFELILAFKNQYERNRNFNSLIISIGNFIRSKGGKESYRDFLLHRKDNNWEVEENAWKSLFSILSEKEIINIIREFQCLQILASDNILRGMFDSISQEWGLNKEMKNEWKKYKNQQKIKEIEDNIHNLVKSKSIYDLEKLLKKYKNKLSEESIGILNDGIYTLILNDIENQISLLSSNVQRHDNIGFLNAFNIISVNYFKLSEKKERKL